MVIATIPGREKDLSRALKSVAAQTFQPSRVIVQTDAQRLGAAQTRNAAIDTVETAWVAFIDDDDVLYPHHIERLYRAAHRGFCDLVYPWFDWEDRGVIDNSLDPLAAPRNGMLRTPFGLDFKSEQRRHVLETANFIPVTHLSRTSLVQHVKGFPDEELEDWGFLKRMLRAGAVFAHEPTRSWVWRHHGHHTSGQGLQPVSTEVK